MKMNKVVVLLSAYNGEKDLREQIDSILRQKDVDIKIIIRDDGSTDKTVNIVDSYHDERIVLLKGENLGYANSFLTLIKDAPQADYYAFSDQDDVWEEKKLSIAIERMCDNKCNLYTSALKIVDENLQYQYTKSFDGYVGTVGSTLSRNMLAGCTMVFGN